MCKCTHVGSIYCEKCIPLEGKLKIMPIENLREFLKDNFHSIKHSKSFAVLIDRLEETEIRKKELERKIKNLWLSL